MKGTTTKVEAMEKMLHTQTGKWLADGSTTDGYTRIPMYGEKVISKITPSMDPITGINMKRMLARNDIRNNSATSNFTVEEVYLANYNTTGYIAPAWNTNGQVTEVMERMSNGEDFSFSFDSRVMLPDSSTWQFCTISGAPYEFDSNKKVLKYVGTRKNNTEVQKKEQFFW